MPSKIFNIETLGEVVVFKRRGARYLRLRLGQDGRVKVTIPYWTPYQAGLQFALSRQAWIEKHRPTYRRPDLKSGDLIGKNHRLFIETSPGGRVTSRLKGDTVLVKAPASALPVDIQAAATKAAERALKKEAEALLPQRLEEIAHRHGFNYNQLVIKRMTSRWGSCNSDKRITLNYFLLQLPWELIDYVIIHELAHTRQLNHSPKFWAEVGRIINEPKKLQKTVRQYKTMILPG